MIALMRHLIVAVLLAQRWLPPVLLHLAMIGIGTVNGSGPFSPVAAIMTASVLVATAWLAVLVIDVEHPTHRAITVVTAGAAHRVPVAAGTVAVLGGIGLAGVGTALALLLGRYALTPTDLLAGGLAQVAGVLTGVAVGTVCSRLVLVRPAVSLLALLAVLGVLLLVPGLPPVNPLLTLLGSAPTGGVPLLAVGGHAALALLLVAASITTVHRVTAAR